jgi:alpha-ribazole phosphatase/probable phosphoglycerate mutase
VARNRAVRVWCLRHGESRDVVDRVAGAMPSAPLTAHGRDQAVDAARSLAAERIVRVYASSALRAEQTASLFARIADVEVTVLADLAEVGVGEHEGSRDPAIHARTADVLRAWVVDGDLDQRVGDGESGHEVLARMTSAFQAIADEHAGRTVALVGHVGSLTVALSVLCGLGSRVWGTPLEHARPFRIEWDGKAWRCPAWPG